MQFPASAAAKRERTAAIAVTFMLMVGEKMPWDRRFRSLLLVFVVELRVDESGELSVR